MKIKGMIFIILSLVFVACGTTNVNVRKTINRNANITIYADDDPTNTKERLESLLFNYGFNIVSSNIGNVTSTTKSSSTLTENSMNSTSISTSNIQLNAQYLIETNYSYYYDFFYWSYTFLTLKMSDLTTGEIVLFVNFQGDKSVNSVLNEVAAKINNAAK